MERPFSRVMRRQRAGKFSRVDDASDGGDGGYDMRSPTRKISPLGQIYILMVMKFAEDWKTLFRRSFRQHQMQIVHTQKPGNSARIRGAKEMDV